MELHPKNHSHPTSPLESEGRRRGASASFEPISVSMADAARITGLSRSQLYVYAKQGTLPLRKVGGRTLVLTEDLRRLVLGEAA